MLSNKFLVSILACGFVFLVSCSGQQESEVAANIKLQVNSQAIVLPSKLLPGSTCLSGGVDGPRIRMRGSISWPTEMSDKYGNLIPLVMALEINNPRVEPAETTFTVSSTGSVESIAFVFGIDPTANDYVPADGQVYSSGDAVNCYFDYGGLPKPTTELKGAAQLKVLATIRLSGVTRKADGTETPFIKEIKTNLVYSAGSIPISN